MASSIQCTVLVAMSLVVIAMVQSHPIAKSMVTQYIEPLCTTFKAEVLNEGRCNGEVIDELIEHADNIERTATIREYDEELLEVYLEHASMNKLCYSNGMAIKNACEVLEGVCTFGDNVLPCKDVTAMPPTEPATTAAPAPVTTGAPTQPIVPTVA